ncbi:MAG: hypothetical protein OIF55_10565 [Amphritea sp.]|nr:hypothetical protein [Amphritea sp.]
MKLRFRIGPFTFGKGGTRLSIWKGGTGVSIPLSDDGGESLAKVKIGPVSAYFNSARKEKVLEQFPSNEACAVDLLLSDRTLMGRLEKNGVPWRGLQECLKEALPLDQKDRNDAAFRLVPKVMNAAFGPQNEAWKTEKRPAKSGNGDTTWIVLYKS